MSKDFLSYPVTPGKPEKSFEVLSWPADDFHDERYEELSPEEHQMVRDEMLRMARSLTETYFRALKEED